jgi:ATP-dependent DNA ligase
VAKLRKADLLLPLPRLAGQLRPHIVLRIIEGRAACAAIKIAPCFVIGGEAVMLGVDGVADSNALHLRKHDHEVQLYAFDIMALDSEDLRALPLSMRKTNLARLLARRPDGVFVAPFETGEIGLELFRAACGMGLERLVSKPRHRPYQAGRSTGSR